MNLRTFGIAAAAVTAGIIITQAQTTPTTVDGLVSAAKVAAGTDWPGTFTRLCIPPPAGAARGGGAGRGDAGRGDAGRGDAGRGGGARAGGAQGNAGRGAAAAATPPRERWYAEPAKVADNFYFIGEKDHSAWALVGNQGIIVIEALYQYATADEVIGGLKKLGLDVNKVKYAVMSHAHGDHDGGAAFLQDSIPGMHLVYGAADWDSVDQRTGSKPKRDTVGTDGMTLSVGDASLKILTMPGHTAGTLSYLFEIKDNGKPLRVVYVGGTAIPFDGTAAYYDGYLASSKKVADAAAAYGATVLLSNHTEFDNAYYKAHTAANRKPGSGAANPFEVGKDGVARYFTVVQDCTMAAKLRSANARM